MVKDVPVPVHPSPWVTLALLKRPQGRKGELLAELLTDFPERFTARPDVYLAKPGFTGPVDEARAIHIAGHWLPVGRSRGRVVLAFEGIDTISKAEELSGLEVVVPEEQRVELDEDSAYISDLVGCVVYQRRAAGEQRIGTVEDVDFPLTADGSRQLDHAAPLLVVTGDDGAEILIPYVKAFLVLLDLDKQRILMDLPAGLLDLNATSSASGRQDDDLSNQSKASRQKGNIAEE